MHASRHSAAVSLDGGQLRAGKWAVIGPSRDAIFNLLERLAKRSNIVVTIKHMQLWNAIVLACACLCSTRTRPSTGIVTLPGTRPLCLYPRLITVSVLCLSITFSDGQIQPAPDAGALRAQGHQAAVLITLLPYPVVEPSPYKLATMSLKHLCVLSAGGPTRAAPGAGALPA